jgi:hypothetical protein
MTNSNFRDQTLWITKPDHKKHRRCEMINKAIKQWKIHTAKEKNIFISTKVKTIHAVVDRIVNQLLDIDIIQFVRITETDLQASNIIAVKGRTKIPISTPGHPNAIGVHLALNLDEQTVLFHELTSARKGYGKSMVQAIMTSLSDDWQAEVIMDYSEGFWDKMLQKYNNIVKP